MCFKRFVLLMFLCSTLFGYAQKSVVKSISLEWDMSSVLETSQGNKQLLPLVKGGFVDENGVPVYQMFWEVPEEMNNVSYTLENIVSETVDSKYLNAIDKSNLSTEVSNKLTISKSPKLYGLSLVINPLVNINGEVKKLISFDVVYQLTNRAQKLSTTANFGDSVLKDGRWFKFAIDRTGVFKIDAAFLNSIGLSTEGLNPRNIRIYGNGSALLPNLNSDFRYNDLQENDILVVGEEDGAFDESDYILFYGIGPDDWINDSESTIRHRKNIYTERGFYFITVDKGPGARIATNEPLIFDATERVTTFKDYIFKEDEFVNLLGGGQQWFGDAFDEQNIRNYSLNFENIDISKDIQVRIRAAASSNTTTQLSATLNGSPLETMNFSAISVGAVRKYDDDTVDEFVSVDTPNINISLNYNNNGLPNSLCYLDYIEIIGDKLLRANGSQFGFRNYSSQDVGKVLEYSIENKNAISMVWDVTDFLHPKSISNEKPEEASYDFKALSGVFREYRVLNTNDYYAPIAIENAQIGNQNLHGLRDIQYLIITREELVSQAQRIANYHQNNSALNCRVVSLKQIYNEFGSGSPDITAIRDFVKYLYDNATSEDNKVKYLCSFGDSTYDYKDRLTNNNNIVPVYLSYDSFSLVTSYVTDDYYGMMDSWEGTMLSTDKQDVATGRILVSDNIEAEIVVSKLLNYYTKNSFGAWRNSIVMFTDDMDNASEVVFMEDMDRIAEAVVLQKPQLNIKKIYADAYVQLETAGGSRYPDVNAAVSNSVEKGSLMINYFGHGGEQGLGSERLMTINDIKSWVNYDKPPLFVTITCDFTRFDNPFVFTAGEEMVVARNGGSPTLITTTREVYIREGRRFNQTLMPKVLDVNNEGYTISEALMHAKNETPLASKQHFFIYSIGDPAMRLGIPEPNIKVTHINDKDVTVSRDTLKALSKIKITGIITDGADNKLTDFSGELSSTIFDKISQRSTLNNDGFTEVIDGVRVPIIRDFNVQESNVYRGKTKVVNGEFSYEFIVPKDIKLSFGKSKISLFATNDIDNKGGVDIETIIGGLNENAEEDIEGPEIALYMNDETFVDGANTSATPNLIAQFSDASGINTSSGAIGHAITAVIDGDEGNPIELNEFYESETGDFTKGTLTYTLRNLEPGPHTLKLKVWDTYNNVSEKSLSFTVTEASEFLLENVLNYPNPFLDYTQFWFTHNQPNQLLDVKIYIYTVSGKLIKSINEVIQTPGSLSRSISWNGLDDFGDRIGKGVYVYKLEVKNITTGVKAEKFEKLVMLQ
ncbi:type IX secretion system sortase PorU [Flavicella marina]|uniref:type IX secretion system sortase PorU n=1 Tax=Flavicella marina TaxID=1475951 RepID=UPI00186AC5DB|nr:type IX secretion system sortase PorU [Flavicella marina]